VEALSAQHSVPFLDLLPLRLEVTANGARSLLLQLALAQTSALGNLGRGVLTRQLNWRSMLA
jgi:hypothetical protein